MQVVRHQLRNDVEQPLKMDEGLAERPQRFRVLQVADMVRQDGAAALRETEGALELGAAGQHGARHRGGLIVSASGA